MRLNLRPLSIVGVGILRCLEQRAVNMAGLRWSLSAPTMVSRCISIKLPRLIGVERKYLLQR